ncbi:hypothetical protein COO55_32845 [Rhodococcus opacus]|nr:hypothetical protein COO55_32845 [Rhodococcus opacus]
MIDTAGNRDPCRCVLSLLSAEVHTRRAARELRGTAAVMISFVWLTSRFGGHISASQGRKLFGNLSVQI